MPGNDGFDVCIDPAATTDGITKELKDVIIHEPAASPDTVCGLVMPPPDAVCRVMSFPGTIRHLANTAETNQPAAYHSSNSYHDSLLEH